MERGRASQGGKCLFTERIGVRWRSATSLLGLIWLAGPGWPGSAGSQGTKQPSVVEGDVCWFCLQPGDEAVPGGLAQLHTVETSAKQTLAIKYHEACVGYSNTSMDLQHSIDHRAAAGKPPLTSSDVVKEWHRSHELACAMCGQKGASIVCVICSAAETPNDAWFHFPCARKAAQEGWAGGKVVFSEDRRQLACPRHAHKYVPRSSCCFRAHFIPSLPSECWQRPLLCIFSLPWFLAWGSPRDTPPALLLSPSSCSLHMSDTQLS
jgi:hypothetical protein